ncbi:MAG: response regulator [Eubacteriales bacterium]
MEKKIIMVIDDNVTNLNVARNALEEKYDVYLLPSGEKALKGLKKITPDLILLDVEMPEMSGFEVIQKIKEMGAPISDIPVVFVTAKDDTGSEYEGLNLGAVDYIIKPFSFPLLLKRVEIHLKMDAQQKELQHYSENLEKMVDKKTETIQKKTESIQKLQYAIVRTFADMVEKRDRSTGAHVFRTSEYLKILLNVALEDKVYEDELEDVSVEDYAYASQLHDVGKIGIPDGILLKEGKLSTEEYHIMKSHASVGETSILSAMDLVDDPSFLQIAADIAGSHHEKWDGSGYPRGLKGTEIPICGRLMAIADVYDALISSRAYKPSLTHDETLEIIYKGEGKHFDPVLMEIFRKTNHKFKEISDKYNDVTPKPTSIPENC